MLHQEVELRRMRNHMVVSLGVLATAMLAAYAPHLHHYGVYSSVLVNLYWIWAE
jgi:hypothetical protein